MRDAPDSDSRRALLRAAAAGAASALACDVVAQPAWPSRPLTLIVPFAPGGVADLTARAVATAMSESLGQPIVVDNRPSAGGIAATGAAVRAAPDGHTLLLLSNANAISASLFRKLPYDVSRDLAPVGTLGFFDLALSVSAGSRFRTLGELVANARARPGELTVGTVAIGSTQHLAAEIFLRRAGIEAIVVPYKGTPAVLTALRAGVIDLAFEILAPLLPQLEAGTLRALAVGAARRNPALPAVPTVQEAGIPDYEVASWNALAAPAGTPAPVIARLEAAARQALAHPAVRQRLQGLGVRPQAGGPAELAALLERETRRWGEAIRGAGIGPR
ncbi:Bug family tripartite tricarboxylate transporter substrate binding protein [Zeimonas arvi]|uniref:Tripartite tricarboxylate transporter substrate binding protein n=1 Tax=Zeimonas arvi TaxID=2498847 RepID=A0A5C8NWE4_9BURK|nr:tripartite tricarboxylate transporter substrate-binding protein [Zeimonas arvi]TXL65382.1 tripartite tricarboxylate transporter substrate binding protein [Zeimonas arvi]